METTPVQPKASRIKLACSALLLAVASGASVIRAMIADSVHSGPELLGVALSPVFLVMLGVWLQGLRKKNRRPFDMRLLITSAGICLLSIMSMSNARL